MSTMKYDLIKYISPTFNCVEKNMDNAILYILYLYIFDTCWKSFVTDCILILIEAR